MANSFIGQINVSIDTDRDLTDSEFQQFRKALKEMIADHWEMMLYDLAASHGFEIESVNPLFEDESWPLQPAE